MTNQKHKTFDDIRTGLIYLVLAFCFMFVGLYGVLGEIFGVSDAIQAWSVGMVGTVFIGICSLRIWLYCDVPIKDEWGSVISTEPAWVVLRRGRD